MQCDLKANWKGQNAGICFFPKLFGLKAGCRLSLLDSGFVAGKREKSAMSLGSDSGCILRTEREQPSLAGWHEIWGVF